MVNFDFTGTIDVQVTYNVESLTSFDIRPASYGIASLQTGNIVTFSITQNASSPRKLVFRANGDWEAHTLQILTNSPESGAPSPTDPNVYAINPGDPIPLQLPVGKDTYYFKPGVHTLPKGSWVEFDLGAAYPLSYLELAQAQFQIDIGMTPVSLANKFTLETKLNATDPYTLAADGTGNTATGFIGWSFPERTARYVRLQLLGSNTTGSWLFSNSVNELKLYATGSTTDLALNHAVAGSAPSFAKIADGDPATVYGSASSYGNWHSGESFFIRQSSTVYLAAGAIVKGAFASDGVNNITIKGRGILDASSLTHTISGQGESRTGAIWLTSGTDNQVQGITVLDSPMWSVVMNFSTRPVVRNVNILGETTNADGIHFSGSSGGLVSGVFIRTPDDNIVMYHYAAASNDTFSNSVFWGDDAHIFLFGLGTDAGATISDITVQNNDVLNQQGVYDLEKFNGVVKLWPNGGNQIRNMTISDLRIDPFRDPSQSQIFQLRASERFAGEGGGSIDNVHFQNLTYHGSHERPSLIDGTGSVSNVTIDGYTRNGTSVSDATTGNMAISGNISNITANGNSLAPAPVSLVGGGSFESPALGAGYAAAPVASPWTFPSNSGIAATGSDFGVGRYGAAIPPLGSQVGYLQKASAIQQVISAPTPTPGTSYVLSAKLAQRPGNPAPQAVTISIDSTALGTYTPSSTDYETITTPAFPLPAGPHTLTLAGAGSGTQDTTAFVDNVQLSINDSAATYTGTWSSGGVADYIAGDAHWTNTANDSAQFGFTGTSVSWIGSTNSDHGIAQLYIDGALFATIDTYSTTWVKQKNLVSVVGLAPGSHSITIIATGTKNPNSSGFFQDVDGFRVD